MAALGSMQGDDNVREGRRGGRGGLRRSWRQRELVAWRGPAYAKTMMTARRCTGLVAVRRRVWYGKKAGLRDDGDGSRPDRMIN